MRIRQIGAGLTACGVAAGLWAAVAAHGAAESPETAVEEADPPEVVLGERLFMDERFSSPDGATRISCRKCHLVDEDERGMRAYTDFDERSRIPVRNNDSYNQELRNSQTLVDAALMPRLHWDGEFTSLEQLSMATLTGRNMGWLKGEQEKALNQAHEVLLKDEGVKGDPAKEEASFPPYPEQFKTVYGIDLKGMKREEAAGWIARAMSDYMRSLARRNDSPYDEFIELNGLEEGPPAGGDPKEYAARHLAAIAQREKAGTLTLPKEFTAEALKGLRIFFATSGEHAGNCAACHVPPAFTDFSFHNIGISQLEFDRMHGEGSFAQMRIPGAAEAKRPSEEFLGIPSGREPNAMDLGFWNRVSLSDSGLRRKGEGDDAFLGRKIATFKTPTLRNLKFTEPYMHNGGFPTVERALGELVDGAALARKGMIRAADDELAHVTIDGGDIAPLAAFLATLNEVYD